MADLSIDAMRLAGRLAACRQPFQTARIEKICEKRYEPELSPHSIAMELVEYGFLVRHEGDWWQRTRMQYTKELSTTLMAAVQVFKHRQRKKSDVVNTPRPNADPDLARWFSIAMHPVRLTGRVHYLKDDE